MAMEDAFSAVTWVGDPLEVSLARLATESIFHACTGAGSAVDVEDNGDGTYSLSFTPTEAGPFQLAVSLERAASGGSSALRRRCFDGACAAGTTAAQCCVATSPDCSLQAGQQGSMLLRRADRCEAFDPCVSSISPG